MAENTKDSMQSSDKLNGIANVIAASSGAIGVIGGLFGRGVAGVADNPSLEQEKAKEIEEEEKNKKKQKQLMMYGGGALLLIIVLLMLKK